MFSSIMTYVFISIIVIFGGLNTYQYFANKSLEIANKNKDEAIVAYEAIIKVVPFEALTTERKDNADEEKDKIIKSINDFTVISDNNYTGL